MPVEEARCIDRLRIPRAELEGWATDKFLLWTTDAYMAIEEASSLGGLQISFFSGLQMLTWL